MNYGNKISHHLTMDQAHAIIAATDHAFCIGRPLNQFVTIHFNKAGITATHAFVTAFFKLTGDWLRAHAKEPPYYVWVLESEQDTSTLITTALRTSHRLSLLRKGGIGAVSAYNNGGSGAQKRFEEDARQRFEKTTSESVAALHWVRENLDLEGSFGTPAVAQIKTYDALCESYIADIASNLERDDPPPASEEGRLNALDRELRSYYGTYEWNDFEPKSRKNAMAHRTKLIAELLAGIDPYGNPDIKRAAIETAPD